MKGLTRVVLGSVAGSLLGAAAFFAADGLIPRTAIADNLYPAGDGRYGGSAYQEGSGNFWDQNTQYGSGRYGGGSYSDSDGRTIECDTNGMCYAD